MRNNISEKSIIFCISICIIKIGCVKSSVSDPDHLAGSGSVSGNVDLDPGTKKKS